MSNLPVCTGRGRREDRLCLDPEGDRGCLGNPKLQNINSSKASSQVARTSPCTSPGQELVLTPEFQASRARAMRPPGNRVTLPVSEGLSAEETWGQHLSGTALPSGSLTPHKRPRTHFSETPETRVAKTREPKDSGNGPPLPLLHANSVQDTSIR